MKRALILALALSACVKPVVNESDNVVIIKNGNGGNVLSHIAERDRLEALGKPVRIEGYCASACTIFYSLPTACMAEGSSLHFHGANIAGAVWEPRMAEFYRAGIKDKYLAEWRDIVGKPMAAVTREEAKALDPAIQFCEQ